jgi:copper homeostasis protein
MNLEICVDNYESFSTAIKCGADRIELCSSLREGGLTPSYAFMEAALKTDVPVFMMIRPRSCDFLYTDNEIEIMHRDIHAAKKLGAPGVVFGVLTADGKINSPVMKSLANEASGMEITCHRAFDQAKDVFQAVDTLVELGVKRILTSGQAENPYDGMDVLQKIVSYARRRIMVMAAGVTPATVNEIIVKTGVDEVHSAASTFRKSGMLYVKSDAKMGHGEDFFMNVVDGELVREIKTNMAGL